MFLNIPLTNDSYTLWFIRTFFLARKDNKKLSEDKTDFNQKNEQVPGPPEEQPDRRCSQDHQMSPNQPSALFSYNHQPPPPFEQAPIPRPRPRPEHRQSVDNVMQMPQIQNLNITMSPNFQVDQSNVTTPPHATLYPSIASGPPIGLMPDPIPQGQQYPYPMQRGNSLEGYNPNFNPNYPGAPPAYNPNPPMFR